MYDINKQYYEEYLSFNLFLEFRIVDKTKFFKDKKGVDTKRNIMFSKYAQNINDVQEILDVYSGDQYIIYVSSNTRPIKVKTDSSVVYRRTFFFDIEGSGVKPPLTNEEYYQKLLNTAMYVWKKLQDIGIEPNVLKESGRGLHVGIKIIPMSIKKYDTLFKIWWKQFVTEIEEKRPYTDIKFSDNMSNPSRIESAPGSRHNKYEEKPERKVLVLKVHENNMLPILSKIAVYQKRESKLSNKTLKSKYVYDDDNIYMECPEWLLLENYRNLPEGEIHNKIIAMLKCIVRDNELDALKMQTKLQEIGYNEVIDVPHKDMKYSPFVLFNWCMRNYIFCCDNDVVVDFPNAENYFNSSLKNIISITRLQYNTILNIEDRPINSYREMKEFIKEFNTKTAAWYGDRLAIYEQELKLRLEKNCNKKLYDYIINKCQLWDFIKSEIILKQYIEDNGIRRL